MDLIFWVDGKEERFQNGSLSSKDTILTVLRRLGHTSCKEGCGEGGCGACTVIVSWREKEGEFHRPVVSCLTPIFFLHKKHVSTGTSCRVAGKQMSENAAIQCGFCSPGAAVLLTVSTLNNVPDIESLDGLLCRCTGYRPIVSSRKCVSKGAVQNEIASLSLIAVDDEEFHMDFSDGGCWCAPLTLSRLMEVLSGRAHVAGGNQSFPKPQLILGSTDVSYHERYHPSLHQTDVLRVSPMNVYEMRQMVDGGDGYIRFGAALSIEEFRKALRRHGELSCFQKLAEHLKYFGNMSVRSMGTIGGSVVACDPLSDLLPPLRVLNAQLTILSSTSSIAKSRSVSVADFVDMPRSKRLVQGEIVLDVAIPKRDMKVLFKKVGKRKTDAQALVSVAISENDVLCVSGIPGKGPAWKCEVQSLRNALGSVVPDVAYRYRVVLGLARRFASSGKVFDEHDVAMSSVRMIGSVPVADFDPYMKNEHEQLCQGKSPFVADLSEPSNCLFGAFAFYDQSSRATNLCLDLSAAQSAPGVVTIATGSDVKNPEHLKLGTLVMDEEVFATRDVHFFGQPVAMVVAKSMEQAREAARRVVCHADILPPVHNIYEAIEKGSFFESLPVRELERRKQNSYGPLRTISGTVFVGGQEHLYLEPQSCLVDVRDTVLCYASCQNPSRVQWAIARVLDLSLHDVRCVVPRIGGGFGGKQDRPQFLAAAAAIASRKARAPVKVVLKREEDMVITGQRHPFLTRFTATLEERSKKIVGLEAEIYADGGFSVDLSLAVLEVFMFAMDGTYAIDRVKLTGRVCRTNRPSNTAFRGFGKPQATITIEKIIEICASALQIRPDELRQNLLYRPGDLLLSRVPVSDGPLIMYERLMRVSDYARREEDVQAWNAANVAKGLRRGLAYCITKNNTGFDVDWMNQASAAVSIYHDGTVIVHCAGTEMGQGLRAKMRQIVAQQLGIEQNLVRVAETDTSIVINSSPTAATTGTDLNGKACIHACEQLKARLAPFEHFPWTERCRRAFESKISLQAAGYHAYEDYAYNFDRKTGDWSYYYIYGACASEVEVDLTTGEFSIVRTDIVQEVGKSLNPVIDVGQIEGGFMQGVGLYTMEDMVWAEDGHLRSRNVSTYKIPAAEDIPKDFRVHLVETHDETKSGALGSKTVGEAGLQHAASVWLAIARAIDHVSALPIPATVPSIEAACSNRASSKI